MCPCAHGVYGPTLLDGDQAAIVDGMQEEEELGSQYQIASRIQGTALPAADFYCLIWFSRYVIMLSSPFKTYYNINIMHTVTF